MRLSDLQKRLLAQRPDRRFIATFDTTLTSIGSSDSDQIALPLFNGGTYDFVVDWGDGSSDVITAFDQAERTHTYASAGIYEIKISGLCRGWRFANTGDRLKILNIKNWGTSVEYVSATNPNLGTYRGCTNLDFTAKDAPVLLGSIVGFFMDCSNLVGNISINTWDVSNSVFFGSAFQNCTNFNQPLGNWDVSNATSFFSFLGGMFQSCSNFNQNINTWDVSSGTIFLGMFNGCSNFNQPLNDWNVSSGTSFSSMFNGCSNFNQPLNDWNVSSGTSFSSMFAFATAFNQPLDNWDVGKGTSFSQMFRNATAFNQPLNTWDVGKGTNFNQMFSNATAFNQPLGNWDVSSATNMVNFMQLKTFANYSAENLDSIYNGWSQLTLNPNISIGFNNIKYTSAGQAGRDILTGSPNNWIITDGGQE